MRADRTASRVRRAALAAVLASLACACAAPASAKIARNTIDPVAVVADGGRHVVATGPMACTAGQRVVIHVTLTQRSTGATAEGRTMLACTGNEQQWEVHALAQTGPAFEPGAATAVALARTSERGAIDDAHQWLVEVTLVP